MEYVYTLTGMTCQGCAATVKEKLSKVDGVEQVWVNLEGSEVRLSLRDYLPLSVLEAVLPDKYSIEEKSNVMSKVSTPIKISKWVQLRPLFLIFAYLVVTSFLLHYKNWNVSEAMLDFMGLFYIVFSFFKLLDLKGFRASFRMYDPLAKVVPVYGWVYPFLELALGILFLMRIQVSLALMATLVVLGITTVGVMRTLLSKKSIQCACLGTVLRLPMTEATFIENAIMLVMAVWMLW